MQDFKGLYTQEQIAFTEERFFTVFLLIKTFKLQRRILVSLMVLVTMLTEIH